MKTVSIFRAFLCVIFISVLPGCDDEDSGGPDGTATDQDGNTFKTIMIGNQIWSAENLNVATFRNGSEPFEVNSEEEWELSIEHQFPAYCYYNFDPANAKYGKLYNWHAVKSTNGLAPEGWHIATDAEWTILTNSLGGEEMAGFKMKATEWNGANDSGFNALPAGMYNGVFSGLGNWTAWWTSTANTDTHPWQRVVTGDNEIGRGYYFNSDAFLSVRLVKD